MCATQACLCLHNSLQILWRDDIDTACCLSLKQSITKPFKKWLQVINTFLHTIWIYPHPQYQCIHLQECHSHWVVDIDVIASGHKRAVSATALTASKPLRCTLWFIYTIIFLNTGFLSFFLLSFSLFFLSFSLSFFFLSFFFLGRQPEILTSPCARQQRPPL